MNFLHLTSSAADTAGGRIKQAHIASALCWHGFATERQAYRFIESLAT